jgi:magnesium chelatase accessory protein
VSNPSSTWTAQSQKWPLHEYSRIVAIGPIGWHVQILGQGPPLLLVHGAGASTHSFRALMPQLAGRFTVVAIDLPGHGFSSAEPTFAPALPAVAAELSNLIDTLGLQPVAAIGHSAGAAVLARMTLDGRIEPRLLVGLAAALFPLRGLAQSWLLPAAWLLSRSSLLAHLIALQAQSRDNVARLVSSTGSTLAADGIDLYQRLASNPRHVAGLLALLAAWDLEPLYADLPRLRPRCLLLAGENDRAIPVLQQRQVAARIPGAQLQIVKGTGHLLHEEQPATIARLVLAELEALPPADPGRPSR